MIKVFDNQWEYLATIDSELKDVYMVDELKKGQRAFHFLVPVNNTNLVLYTEENYILTEDYSFVIKEVNSTNNNYIEVYCSAWLEDLKDHLHQTVDILDSNPQTALNKMLEGTDWVLNYNSQNRTLITYQKSLMNSYDVIVDICTTYLLDYWFDCGNKILYVGTIGANKGQFYSNDLKLKSLNYNGNTYNFTTVLYPIGKDGLSIHDVNAGRDYISNFNYCAKIVERVKHYDDIDQAEVLKNLAIADLSLMANPKRAFKLVLTDIGNVQIGDIIRVIDNIHNVKQALRIVKIVRYPFEPEKGTVEVATLQPDFSQQFVDQQKKVNKDLRYLYDSYTNTRESYDSLLQRVKELEEKE